MRAAAAVAARPSANAEQRRSFGCLELVVARWRRTTILDDSRQRVGAELGERDADAGASFTIVPLAANPANLAARFDAMSSGELERQRDGRADWHELVRCDEHATFREILRNSSREMRVA